MVPEQDLHNPFGQSSANPSAAAMDANPVQTPPSSLADDDGDAGAPRQPTAPTPSPPAAATPALLHIAPAAPVAASAPPALASSVLQTVDIRRHVPVVLDLTAGNYAQWRRHFDAVLGMFGLRDHVDAAAVAYSTDPEWVMADHAVVHWLYATITPELLDAVMEPEDTALSVWTAVDDIFRANQLSRAVYIDAEYHAVVQGDLTIMQYCTKLKLYADQLRDLGQPVTETRQVFHLLRGLNRQYHNAIPHITARVPLPTFLQTRSFLLLEEHRTEQSAHQQAAHALYAGRSNSPAPPPPAPDSATPGGRGRGRQRKRGRGNGGASSSTSPAPPPPRAPSVPAPAPGANSWTGVRPAPACSGRVPALPTSRP